MKPQTKTVAVLRYRPEQDKEPFWQDYEVPFAEDTSVLAALNYIKDELDGTLSFRWSCRQAICGSCGLMIGGKPRLACKTFLRDFEGKVTVEALAHFPIERDLVVVMDDFIAKLERVKPWLMPREERAPEDGEYRQTPQEMSLYEQFAGCINCGLCYAACPQVGLNPNFLGPGAIALLHRYNLDSRDGGSEERMKLISAELGVFNCTAVGYCSAVCPKIVDPANAVNVNKMNSARDYFFRFLPRPAPKGGCQ
ncbi:MAG: succinate dehydrogenase/fumarate reductase iron-sulfur subunit [Candidatus Dactylopiibacterium carminicum]|uniref:Succinate dehydrogenase iron-sulfur subunit n=1 Tax=Candidatus Dactylopiibacterium carminicum TaxID=857335 RepID=A0A272EYF7_9RHOO|nr:succinate dehydrogenase/fumarate reductase iron-sulfur subunit [Candidatus Dactylopiibacterium carminicum]KAF7600286.1 succinate dehydrogenase/fumarate reductase iron-sulfur subunit [Candidatus Dactylopiibacterium carminicum]PAS94660.1 MAG: succinate dehydrogenase/fumarate reductase iron-sulfur subunit [Candidatus Dactylopiibacterium carminicum]PAS96947.1 MAG: succinate dehydrogenase/fumarate reductase iron-sulfur subunit [Candidatus Dactylopiibacterium carminicum]PAT00287.1 MAG: succinate d